MKILLVRPPRRNRSDAGLSVPPLGLAYIAAVVRKAGYEVNILDAYATNMSWTAFEDFVRNAKPDVLGLGAMTPVADVAARAINLCRPYAKRIVIGGPHPTAVGDVIFEEMPGLDAAVIGEGENVIVPLLEWVNPTRDPLLGFEFGALPSHRLHRPTLPRCRGRPGIFCQTRRIATYLPPVVGSVR